MSLVYIIEKCIDQEGDVWEPLRGSRLALERSSALDCLRIQRRDFAAQGTLYRVRRYRRLEDDLGGYVAEGPYDSAS